MFVIKRDGRHESVQFDKITLRLNNLLSKNITIDTIKVTQKLCERIYSGITTSELDELAAQVCMNLVFEHPAYSILGSRIVISNLHKNTNTDYFEVVQKLVNNIDTIGDKAPLVNENFYNTVLKYKDEINEMLDYTRDYNIDYFGFKTLERSYLLKVDKQIIERPQHLFMRVAIGIHYDDIKSVRNTYNNISLKNYTHASPTLFNAGSLFPSLASCYLLKTQDSIEGIFDTVKECAMISKGAGGLGLSLSNIRAKNSYIRKTHGKSDGIVPLLRVLNDTMRYINQGSRRLGSLAVYIEPHHADIFDFLEAKRNTGVESDKARDLFYALWISDLFMEKVENDEEWALMCPDTCKNLDEVFGEEYNTLYNQYWKDNKYVKIIKARDLWDEIIKCQIEAGTPYISYKDAANKKTNQQNIGIIRSSNLCNEIYEVTSDTETAVCNLASICLQNMLETTSNYNTWLKLTPLCNRSEISLLFNGNICIYTKNNCFYCKLLKALLNRTKLIYTEIDADTVLYYKKVAGSNLSFDTIPQVFVLFETKIHYIGGYDNVWNLLKPRINYLKLQQISAELVHNLNKVIDQSYYPVQKAQTSNINHRPLGIGVQGLQDLYFKLRLPFTSDEAMQINKHIFETIYYGALKASLKESKIHGPYSTFKGSPMSRGEFQFNLWGLTFENLSNRYNWKELQEDIIKFGIRNSLLIALMPTASTSQILGSTESFEPITSNLYTRKTLAGEFIVLNKYLTQDLLDCDLWTEDIKNRLIFYKGDIQHIKAIPEFFRNIYKTVWNIPQKQLIKMSADRAPFICQSQSLNLFFEKPNYLLLTSAHFYGYKLGLKTGSYYIRSKPGTNAQRFGLDVNIETKIKDEDENENEICINCSS